MMKTKHPAKEEYESAPLISQFPGYYSIGLDHTCSVILRFGNINPEVTPLAAEKIPRRI
jgi:hypothetical protein